MGPGARAAMRLVSVAALVATGKDGHFVTDLRPHLAKFQIEPPALGTEVPGIPGSAARSPA